MSEAKARRSNRAAALMEGEAERSVQEQGEGGSVRLGNYLRRLREGYGYTLRRVEERASALGESIDHGEAHPAGRDRRNCLSCHPKVGQDVLKTVHWNWKGYSPTLKGYEHRIDIGLSLMVNNSCIAIGPNLQECASCHIGYGWVDEKFDFANPTNIDCLVCHDTTGTYRKDLGAGGLPNPALDLVAIAKKVGRPSRQACGSCHFLSGGSPSTKHGNLEPALADPPTDFDTHMGTLKMRCQECHTTTEHRIAGVSMSAPART